MTAKEIIELSNSARELNDIVEFQKRKTDGVSIYIDSFSIPVSIGKDSPLFNAIMDVVEEKRKLLEKEISSVEKKSLKNSCANCKFMIPGGEFKNDLCDGSHPVEFAADDFLCNRWEERDENSHN